MIHIATATDNNYLPYAATAMYSALGHHEPADVTFHVLHDGSVGSADSRRLTAFLTGEGAGIEVREVSPDLVASSKRVDRFGSIIRLRLLLPDLLRDVPRVLYLDADTLVADALAPLWLTPLDDAPLAAVANVVEPRMHGHVRSLGISDSKAFFNSGVLLMDLDVMRAEYAQDTMLRLAAEHSDHLVWPDQDVLNVAFADRWRRLHPRWNAMNSLWTWRTWADDVFGPNAVQEATTSPAILHFEGPAFCKPWHYLCDHPWRDAYRRTLARTPWAGTPLEDQTFSVHVIARLPRRWRSRAFWEVVRMRKRLDSIRAAARR